MKGICNYKVVRDGKEIAQGSKENVIFDLPKQLLEKYFDNIGWSGGRIASSTLMSQSYPVDVFLQSHNAGQGDYIHNIFSGVKVYDEAISTEDFKAVKIPILAASLDRDGDTAPAEFVTATRVIDDNEITIQATWNLTKGLTIKSVALCNRFSAENLHNAFLTPAFSWNHSTSNHAVGRFNFIIPLSSTKALALSPGYSSSSSHPLVVGIAHKEAFSLQTFSGIYSLQNRLAFISGGNQPWCSLNPAKTQVWVHEGAWASKIDVFDIASEELIKTFNIPGGTNRFRAVLFSSERDVAVEVVDSNINFYELSKEDETVTLIKTIAAPSGITLTAPVSVNNAFIAFRQGFCVGMPDAENNDEVKTFYSSANSGSDHRFPFTSDSLLLYRGISLENLTGAQANNPVGAQWCVEKTNAFGYMHTTALNFPSPISLQEGDTFVITYKITTGIAGA